jgi:predicted nucleic acid-binding protein
MNVYVESNFVLEHALEQEDCDSCAEIVRLAADGRLNLLIPAFSLAEPHHAIFSKAKARSRLGEDLRAQLGELGRSRPHREIPQTFGTLAAALIERARFEREGVRRAISELVRTAEVIPLDAEVLRAATEMEILYGLSGQDAIVLASVLIHLETHRPTESCFLNRNSKDFDDPNILERLKALDCKFFSTFTPGLAYISARLDRNLRK